MLGTFDDFEEVSIVLTKKSTDRVCFNAFEIRMHYLGREKRCDVDVEIFSCACHGGTSAFDAFQGTIIFVHARVQLLAGRWL